MRSEKISIQRELQEQLDSADYLFVVDYAGMSVSQLTELRKSLSKDNARLRIFKNSFMRRAAADRGWPEAVCDNFKGMVAVIGGDDPVAAARGLRRFHAAHKAPVVRGGVLSEQLVAASDIEALATLPSRDQLRAQVVGALAAPMSGLAGVLSAVQNQLARVLKAIEGKKSAA